MKIHTFERYQYVMTILLAIILGLNAYAQSQERPRYVILITIDGLRAEMIDDPLMPSPFLKMMSREGLRIGRVIGIPPAATYPSHTTLVTGEVPARHRVFYNRPFLWNKDTARISYWYADSIAQIAARFDMTESSVSVTLHRLRAALRQYLEERGFAV